MLKRDTHLKVLPDSGLHKQKSLEKIPIFSLLKKLTPKEVKRECVSLASFSATFSGTYICYEHLYEALR